MTHIYARSATKNETIVELFENYFKQNEYDKLFNYDPYDIFYWEYRMGTWHSRILLESDMAHDTFIVYNTRNVLKKLLSLSPQERADGTIFYELINMNWPILNYWDINSTNTMLDKIKALENRILTIKETVQSL
jgi:hypothetical protein